LILYGDEFEVTNPLGPHATKHTILAFYFTVANLSPYHRSRTDFIPLLALCNSNDTKKYGLNAVAECIHRDLQVLEHNGLAVPGCSERIFGSLIYIAGDNLNSHTIGGFNGSFGPKVLRPCRYCLKTNTELQTVTEVDKLQWRTSQNYD
jgi:hypothetical protein